MRCPNLLQLILHVLIVFQNSRQKCGICWNFNKPSYIQATHVKHKVLGDLEFWELLTSFYTFEEHASQSIHEPTVFIEICESNPSIASTLYSQHLHFHFQARVLASI